MLIHLLLFFTIILTLAGFLGQYGYWFDLASHFRAQYLALQLLCVLFYLLRKQWNFLSITLLIALTNLTLIVPFYIRTHQTARLNDGKTISIMLVNVNSSNNEYHRVIEYVNLMKPDILALEEINDQWLAALSTLLATYPYQELLPRGDNFGIGLYSKIPSDMKIVYYGSVQVPSVLANYMIDNKPITLLFTHPVPPANLEYYQWRNEQLQEIVSQRTTFGENLILVGDLNTTSWSYHFRNFIKKMDLIDTQRGFGLQPTWPTMLPIMGITIDHILSSRSIKVLKRTVGPYIGSDHYPVYIRLGIN